MNTLEATHAQWRALATGIAGNGRMRVSRDGGRTYPRRYERQIGDEPPNQPAAVLIYDRQGAAHTFCVDLDAAKGGPEAVEADFRALRTILTRLGVAHFADQSPNGGIHVYVPLSEPLPYPEAANAARSLAARLPTMDPMPMLGIESGCIRPPGARHKSGGHQLLLDGLSDAYAALMCPTTSNAWTRLVTEIGPVDENHNEAAPDAIGQLQTAGRGREPDATYQQIARTGQYDPARYSTASEARQAVIWAAAASGWAFSDVVRRLNDGTWPGLAALYGRYRAHSRHGAVARDWTNAIRFEKQRRESKRNSSVRLGTTSEPKTHRGASPLAGAHVHQQIRTWKNAVDLLYREGRRDHLAERAVLYALAEAGQKSASLEVEFGNRSLAIATGLNQATVGKCLKQLSNAERPLIQLLSEAKGTRAHLWQLVIPDEHLADVAGRIAWKKGKIHGVRAAFRELGLAAAFVYAALEQQSTPSNGRDLAKSAGVGTTATYDALETLAAFNLARRDARGWVVGEASLGQLAEQFGIDETVRQQIERYRAERLAFWAAIGIVRLVDETGTVGHYATGPPPPDDDTLMGILERELGAQLVHTVPA